MAPIMPIVMGLSQIAPIIARWLGGENAGQVADKVVGIAQAVTGASTPEEALAKIQADAKLAADFQLAIMANETELERMYLGDRQDARKRDVALAQAGQHNHRANWMILGDVVGLVACLYVLTAFPDLPGEVRGIISTIAGFFGLGLRDAHSFEFGSSRGSREKDELLAKR